MSTPKLYLIIINENTIEKVVTFRELDAVQKAWKTLIVGDRTGVVHCGFVRPSTPERLEIPKHIKGKIVYSAALKWALQDLFKSSNKPVANIPLNGQSTPCYLALNQWGYEIAEDQGTAGELEPTTIRDNNKANHKNTVSLAAQQVLLDANKQPLNNEEIFARIFESNYFYFDKPTPVSMLDVSLSRETIGSKYLDATKEPVFGKTDEGRYYLLENKVVEPKGWVKVLATEKPEQYKKLHEYGVSDEESYLSIRGQLPEELSTFLDNIRFYSLKTTINLNNPDEILRIAPLWLLKRHINDLGFTLRASNILLQNGISKMEELAELTTAELKRLPSMGKGSISNICEAIVSKISKTVGDLSLPIPSDSIENGKSIQKNNINEIGNIPLASKIAQTPLRQHLIRTLDGLEEVDRVVLHGRLGYKGKVFTLEEIGEKLDVTRERIRQRQKKDVAKIIAEEYWDDVIGLRIGQLLLDRTEPLILEMLEIEDAWFQGFMDDSYIYLGNVLQMFSENAIWVIEAQGRNVVTRIKQKNWDLLVRNIKSNLKHKSEEKTWSRADVDQYFESCLAEHSAKELLPLIKEMVNDYLQFESEEMDALLIAYGKSAESVVAGILAQAEEPLHFSEIAKRATEIMGKPVDERRAHAAVIAKGVWLYDRGTYGLIDHCPLPESKRKSICQIVEHLLYQGEINKQWHSKEIIDELKKVTQAVPKELDPYVLRMCIEGSRKINFLNRMVWARADSGLSSEDRIDVSDAFIQILEEVGEPLSGRDLKKRLSEIRGVDGNMQIHANDRLVAVGPNFWGLSDWGDTGL